MQSWAYPPAPIHEGVASGYHTIPWPRKVCSKVNVHDFQKLRSKTVWWSLPSIIYKLNVRKIVKSLFSADFTGGFWVKREDYWYLVQNESSAYYVNQTAATLRCNYYGADLVWFQDSEEQLYVFSKELTHPAILTSIYRVNHNSQIFCLWYTINAFKNLTTICITNTFSK